ncbi:hypothetical protein PV11_08392 [Exophiala sideris]|uniref:DUF8212 domain-containing protein n=1 Tax=Exophiala sideris TaxID=1016849 RepID=A0A0D1Z229_9EURO|nr:hypothetical protein PV11_08392 [Exophiala sideris]
MHKHPPTPSAAAVGIVRFKTVPIKLWVKAWIISGLTHAALTKAAVQNYPKQSTRCTVGIEMLKYAMYTSKTLILATDRLPPQKRANWSYLGRKGLAQALPHDRSLDQQIIAITGIGYQYLSGELKNASIAMKMSWAARRETTRLEDEAYCLLGLFDVNMPLLYGEGARAFLRLQEEIIKTSDDQSIFAWSPLVTNYDTLLSGLLSHTPANFKHSGSISRIRVGDDPYHMTNKGLAITLGLTKAEWRGNGPNDRVIIYAILQCYGPDGGLLVVPVAQPFNYDCDLFHVPGPLEQETPLQKPTKSVQGVCRDNRFSGLVTIPSLLSDLTEPTDVRMYVSPQSSWEPETKEMIVYVRSVPSGYDLISRTQPPAACPAEAFTVAILQSDAWSPNKMASFVVVLGFRKEHSLLLASIVRVSCDMSALMSALRDGHVLAALWECCHAQNYQPAGGGRSPPYFVASLAEHHTSPALVVDIREEALKAIDDAPKMELDVVTQMASHMRSSNSDISGLRIPSALATRVTWRGLTTSYTVTDLVSSKKLPL